MKPVEATNAAASAAIPTQRPAWHPRALLASVLATICATCATLAPGFAEWESRAWTGPLYAGMAPPTVLVVLLAVLPGWLPLHLAPTAKQRLLVWIAHTFRWVHPAGSALGLRSGYLRRTAPLRDAAFRVHGCLAGVALGVMVAGSAQQALFPWLFDTPSEGVTAVLGAVLGILSGSCAILVLVAVPRLAATWRIEGQVDALAAMRILQFGADALILILGTYAIGYATGRETAPSLLLFPLITLAALTGYAVPQLLWREQAVPARGVWIVHLDPAAAGRGAVQAVLRQADQLAHTLLQGPMTVVVDAVLDIGGEQLHAALSLGRERAMFPRLEVELADWGMLLPPAGRWQASPVRELHLPPHLMLPALARFAGAADLVILLSSTVEPVEAWKQRFRHADDLVVWHRGDLEPAPAMPPAPATGTASPGTSGKR